MPGHACAADASEGLWRCHECGWAYPNHYPSAKHRRNHRKQCAKISGFVRTSDAQVANGSSADGFSDEEHYRSSVQAVEKNGYHQEHPQPPTQAGSSSVEQICDNRSNLLSSNDGEAHITPNIHDDDAASTRNLNHSHSKSFAEMRNGNDPGHSNFRSAQTFKGQWTCRLCGWAYPNAHPSAKNRRKHKKTCGVETPHTVAGGSSDEASSDDGNGSNDYAGMQEPLKFFSTASRGSSSPETINEVSSAKDTDLFEDVEGVADADIAEVSSEFYSRNTCLDGVLGGKEEEKLESCEAQVAMMDESNIQPTNEEACSVPDSRYTPVPLMETTNSKQSQMPDEIERAVSNGVKPSDLDGLLVYKLSLSATSEQVDYEKPHVPKPSQRIVAREMGDHSINGLQQRSSEAAHFQSSVTIEMRGVKGSELDTTTPQPKSALPAVRGKSLVVEERSSPGSPEGLVRSRVQIFEKLAGTSPLYLRKSVSPKTNSGNPLSYRSSLVENGTPGTKFTASDACETPKKVQEPISLLRHQQFGERMAHSAAKLDAPSELQEVMSHVLHSGDFV